MVKSSSQTKLKKAPPASKKTDRKVATVPKKNVTKKVPAAKTKKDAVPLIKAPAEKEFWTNDGQILTDLVSLAESFAAMDNILFQYHVSDDKNDFADWVEHVLEDQDCATSLRKTNTPKKAHGVVVRRLRYYEW